MPDEHPGFDYWSVNDAAHPFPVGEINLQFSDESCASVTAEVTLPQAQPTKKTVAERYIGIQRCAQLWIALECTTNAAGATACEAVMRGRHLFANPDHGETGPGPLLELRVAGADLQRSHRSELLAPHGPHCDMLVLFWSLSQGKVLCDLSVFHWGQTVEEFLEARDKAAREADRLPKPLEPRLILPVEPAPTPTPAPAGPGGDGA